MRKKILIAALVLLLSGAAFSLWAGPTITYIGKVLSDGICVITGGNLTTTGTVTAGSLKLPVAADATLSGTPIIITVYDSATNTPYYFKAYPIKQ